MKYQQVLHNKIQCLICPRKCRLRPGQSGFCGVRKNTGSKIELETYGYNTGLAIDPVEKKPLYHFFPGSKILSFGTTGCCMGCLFCQNFQTSKTRFNPELLNKTSPDEIIQIAKEYNCKGIAFTYNDPIIFFEYAIDTAKLAKKAGIKTIAVTSGFINKEPAEEFFNWMDAANIDIKGFSERFYRKNCLASLAPVLETIKSVKDKLILELTTLIIEGENDDEKELRAECSWIIENLGSNIPLHFSAFSPKYKFLNHTETKFKTLLKAREIALKTGLKYVYTGNLTTVETSTTFCPECKTPVVIRNGYNIKGNPPFCSSCGKKIYGEFVNKC